MPWPPSPRPGSPGAPRWGRGDWMIVGHGIDITDLQSVEQRLASSEGDWIDGAFTVAEQEQADPSPNHVAYYAGRYAAKEAVAKALGTGFSGDVTWLDIEI